MPHPTLNLREFVVRVLVVLALIALALFLWRVADVLLLIFGASLVAILLRAVAGAIARRTPLPDAAALALAVVLLVGLMAAVGWLFGAEISAQMSELVARFPDALASARAWLEGSTVGGVVLRGIEDASPNLGNVATKITQATVMTAGALLQLLVVAFGGLYLAGDPQVYRAGLLKLIPEGARDQVADVIDTSARALRLWLFGQLVTMAAVGLLTGIGLWLIGVPAPLALGLVAALAEFVPYVGPILAAIPGLLIALSVGPETMWWALLVYVVVQQVESNAIVPLMARQVLALPPALVIFSVVALGLVLGPLGLVFATPLTVLLVVAVGKLYVRQTLGQPLEVPGESKGASAAPPRPP